MQKDFDVRLAKGEYWLSGRGISTHKKIERLDTSIYEKRGQGKKVWRKRRDWGGCHE